MNDSHYVIQALLLFGIKAQYEKPLVICDDIRIIF